MTGTPPDFEAMYLGNPDPWSVATSAYERRKLRLVVACLFQPRYVKAWDPACGTGHLARRLARRADRVLATDGSAEAIRLAERTCSGLENVEFGVLRLPEAPPAMQPAPDLLMLSEFFYYLDDRSRADTIRLLDLLAASRCELVAVHWRHLPEDAWLSGAAAQQEIVSRFSHLGWVHQLHHDDEEFVVDSLRRGGGAE